VKIDVVPTYRTSNGQGSRLTWYDTMGKYSTVGLSVRFEPGYRAFISERLQRLDNDADPEQLDEVVDGRR